MPPSGNAQPTLPPAWQEMLARVERALAEAAEAAARRDDALRTQPPAVLPVPEFDAGLARFRERLRGLGEYAGRAEHTVAEADAALADSEDALRAWLQAAEAARRKLAGRAARA